MDTGNTTFAKDKGMHAHADNFIYKMKLTAGARYLTNRRHERRSNASAWAVTVLSMYVFGVSAVLAIYDFGQTPHVAKVMTASTIIMSAFIMIFSVMEQNKKHDLKADMFLRCAQKLTVMISKLELDLAASTVTDVKLAGYVDEYNRVVHELPENHSELHYRVFRININKSKQGVVANACQKLLYWLDCWGILVAAIFVPPITFAAAVALVP